MIKYLFFIFHIVTKLLKSGSSLSRSEIYSIGKSLSTSLGRDLKLNYIGIFIMSLFCMIYYGTIFDRVKPMGYVSGYSNALIIACG